MTKFNMMSLIWMGGNEGGTGEVCLNTDISDAETKEVEEAHQYVKATSLSFYILKNHSFLKQRFK